MMRSRTLTPSKSPAWKSDGWKSNGHEDSESASFLPLDSSRRIVPPSFELMHAHPNPPIALAQPDRRRFRRESFVAVWRMSDFGSTTDSFVAIAYVAGR